jgi:hypothetical protein
MPLPIRRIVAMLLFGVFFNILVIIVVVAATFGLWCPGGRTGPWWCWRPLAASARLFLAVPTRRLASLIRLVAYLQIGHFIHCDGVSVLAGVGTNHFIFHPTRKISSCVETTLDRNYPGG